MINDNFTLKLNNFRCLINTELEFSRINIFIGENNSGKSSILKFLLAIKQSLLNPRKSNLLLNGEYVDLGNYRSVINFNDTSKNIEFGLLLDQKYFDSFSKMYYDFNLIKFLEYFDIKSPQSLNRDILLSKIYRKAANTKTYLKYEVNRVLDKHHSIKTIISNKKMGNLEITINESIGLSPYDGICILEYKQASTGKTYILEEVEYEKNAFSSLISPISLISAIKKQNVNKKNLHLLYYEIAFLLLTQNYFTSLFLNLVYINPMNSNPKRFYYEDDKKHNYVVNDIEKVVHFLKENKISLSLRNKLNSAIKQSHIAQEIELNTSHEIPVMELKIKIKNKWHNITDVGYGVSLQLPLLFESIIAEQNGGEMILIEQPEVHLHPKLHADLINTLLRIGPHNRYIIETHSEHIVRKLQVLVKNKSYGLKPDDISIYYFKRNPKKTLITKHKIDEEGFLSPSFPKGFFDNSYNLAEELFN